MAELRKPNGWHAKHRAQPDLVSYRDRLLTPKHSGVALSGVLLSGLIAIIALLIAERPLDEILLIAFSLQFLVFCIILIMGHTQKNGSFPSQPTIANTDVPPIANTDAPPASWDIWRTYPSVGRVKKSARVALISHDMAESRNIATDLAELGGEVHHGTDRDAMLESVQARPEDWGLVIVDLDSPPDLETVVDDLLDFRAACPGMPIVLLSGVVQRDDFSTHRCPIGDATLRKPICSKQLVEALAATSQN